MMTFISITPLSNKDNGMSPVKPLKKYFSELKAFATSLLTNLLHLKARIASFCFNSRRISSFSVSKPSIRAHPLMVAILLSAVEFPTTASPCAARARNQTFMFSFSYFLQEISAGPRAERAAPAVFTAAAYGRTATTISPQSPFMPRFLDWNAPQYATRFPSSPGLCSTT